MKTHRLVRDFTTIVFCLFFWHMSAQGQSNYQDQQRTTASQTSGKEGTQLQPPFTELDRDGDGYLSKEEARQIFTEEQAFSDADANNDGRLSKQEVEKAVSETTTRQTTSMSAEMRQEAAAEEKGLAGERPEQSGQAKEATSIQVQQEEPEVTVSQQPPQVIVEQPTPKVIVKQPEPNVTVQQDTPEVTVKQPGQPEVLVKQAEQPEVKIIEGSEGSAANQLYAMAVGDVLGKDMVTPDGEDIGEVEQIVLHSGDEQLYAVVSVGGFLGIGGRDVVIPVSELELINDELVLKAGNSKEQVKQQPSYEPKEYTVLEEKRTIGQFADSGTTN